MINSKYEKMWSVVRLPEGFDEYYKYYSHIQEELEYSLNYFDEESRFYDDVIGLFYAIKHQLDRTAKSLVEILENDHNYYDCAEQDFLSTAGFKKILDATEQYEKYVSYSDQEKKQFLDNAIADIKRTAVSQVSGIGFGIITNSLAAHMIYTAQSAAVLKKQIARAEKYATDAYLRVEESASVKVEENQKSYYSKVYVPQMREAINLAYSDMFSELIRTLHNIGFLNMADFERFDYNRSEILLSKLDNTSNQTETIITALALCPYNKNIYLKAAELDGALAYDLEILAASFGMCDIGEYIKEQLTPKKENSIEFYISELIRLSSYRISAFDDNWKLRAAEHLRDSSDLIQKYPSKYAGYGLKAAFVIAANFNTRVNNFWEEVERDTLKCIELYDRTQDDYSCFLDVIGTIFYHISAYYDYGDSEIKNKTYKGISYSEMKPFIVEVKRSRTPTLKFYEKLINLLCEKGALTSNDSLCLWHKSNLLWFCYDFCSARFDVALPLAERQFAISLYDRLCEEDVASYENGVFAKAKSAIYNNQFEIYGNDINRIDNTTSGCYVATAVYGSYDCPEVWTLRRFRDNVLAKNRYGRAFICTYYTVSPVLVKWFGHTNWFKKLWKGRLDSLVKALQNRGFESTPYQDTAW